MIRTGAVDDHPVLLEGIAAVLGRSGRAELTGRAPTVAGLLAAAPAGGGEGDDAAPPYDVVLLDLQLGDGSSPAANTELLLAAGCAVLVYTDGARPAMAWAAVSRGALGVLHKGEPPEAVLDAVLQAAAGETVVSPRMAQAMESAPDLGLLSGQEREVLRLYAADLPAKSVARRLGVTEGTVKEYLKRIRAKLAARSVRATTKLELRDVAERMGLLDDPGAVPRR